MRMGIVCTISGSPCKVREAKGGSCCIPGEGYTLYGSFIIRLCGMSDNSLRLRFVRLYLGKAKMDVCVYDPVLGDVRLVKYVWKAKEVTDEPPENWWSTVVGEVKYQRGVELRKKKGTFVVGD